MFLNTELLKKNELILWHIASVLKYCYGISQWPFEKAVFYILNCCHCSCVVSPATFSYLFTPGMAGTQQKRFSSSWKQIWLSQCSVIFEGNWALIHPLLRTFNGGLNSFKRVGVCVKEKVQDNHEFWRNKWRELVLYLWESTNWASCELVISQSTIWHVLRRYLHLKPYRLCLAQIFTKTLLFVLGLQYPQTSPCVIFSCGDT